MSNRAMAGPDRRPRASFRRPGAFRVVTLPEQLIMPHRPQRRENGPIVFGLWQVGRGPKGGNFHVPCSFICAEIGCGGTKETVADGSNGRKRRQKPARNDGFDDGKRTT